MGYPKVAKAGVATGKTGKIAPWGAIRTFEIFKVGQFPIWGLMGQHTEETVLNFPTTANAETYIDLSSAMTVINRRQFHQFTRKGTPLCYEVTIAEIITNGDDISEVLTAPNNWTTRNACVKMSAAWKKQLKDAGIKLSDLSKYGRRLRIAFDSGMSLASTGGLLDNFEPYGYNVSENAGEPRMETYVTPAGTTVGYRTAAEFTRVTIPDEAGGDSVEMNLCLLGKSGSVGANNYFGVLDQYLGSRGGVIDEPASGQQLPDDDNLLQRMFSSAQPSTDEIIESVEDYQEFRPYPDGELDATSTPPTSSTLCELAHIGGFIQGPRSRADGSPGAATSVHLKCPLGMIKLLGNANKSEFMVTVHAIYEM